MYNTSNAFDIENHMKLKKSSGELFLFFRRIYAFYFILIMTASIRQYHGEIGVLYSNTSGPTLRSRKSSNLYSIYHYSRLFVLSVLKI